MSAGAAAWPTIARRGAYKGPSAALITSPPVVFFTLLRGATNALGVSYLTGGTLDAARVFWKPSVVNHN